ncbi:MAG: ABC transporter permease subunit [Anaerolineaceae bacterium]|jgi:ABC-type Na+ efflux pump permease subunit
MNTRIIKAIAFKDLLEVRHNRDAWLPMIIVPLIFVIIMPLAIILIPSQLGAEALSDPEIEMFLRNMPAGMQQHLAGLDEIQTIVALMLGYMLAPLILIFPLMSSTIIAAESFAGERERKTMESLLYTPATDQELFIGKVTAGFIPALIISIGSFLLYTIVLNAAGWSLFERIWFPLPTWYPLIFWITPALALTGVSVTVLISSKTQTFMGAYQSSGSLVLIVMGLVIGQISGVVYLSVGVGLVIGLVCWIAALALTHIAIKSFNRSKLLVSVSR